VYFFLQTEIVPCFSTGINECIMSACKICTCYLFRSGLSFFRVILCWLVILLSISAVPFELDDEQPNCLQYCLPLFTVYIVCDGGRKGLLCLFYLPVSVNSGWLV
jgi:hypothetical protein